MKRGTKVIQCRLIMNDRPNVALTTYVDYKQGLREGSLITLKGDESILWKVAEMYRDSETLSEKLHTDWDNNI